MTDERAPYEPDEGNDEYYDDGYDVRPHRDWQDAWLLRVALMLLVVFLASGISLVLYTLSMRGAPRTGLERAVTMDEVAVKENPKDMQNWARLALAYNQSGRFNDAMRALDQAREIEHSPVIDLTEADILRIAKRYDEALRAYNALEKFTNSEYDRYVKERKRRGIIVTGQNEVLYLCLYGRGQVYDALDDNDRAIADFRKAAGIMPTDAEVWVEFAKLLVKDGRDKEAADAYRQALRYIPDYKPALDGLKRLGEE
ncbi:MAG: tetratricopeptide repeat protein [Coriobacteriia bacterium]